jgi:alpha-glucosidase
MTPLSAFGLRPAQVSEQYLASPNGHLVVAVNSDAEGRLTYSVAFKRRVLLSSCPLGLDLGEQGTLEQALRIAGVTRNHVNQRYALMSGKARYARDHYHELSLHLEANGVGRHRREFQLIFRAYDDGIALRYKLPWQRDIGAISVSAEMTGFHFSADYECWGFNVGKFNTGHEGEFHPVRASTMRHTDLFDSPLVCRAEAATFAIAQADLTDYPGMGLSRPSDGKLGVAVRLAPRMDDSSVAARLLPGRDLVSPWRVVMVADHLGRLIESALIENLNPASKLADTSWIMPGKYAWNWWSGDTFSDAAHPGMNNATIEPFIQFAREMHLEYMIIDAGWYVAPEGKMEGPDADVTRSIPEIDLPALVEYASRRNVGLFVWVHWKALDARMNEALALYQRLGLRGIKVDFMDRDDQWMVEWYHQLLRKAAEHRLLVDLHGAYPPTGIRRTYPNLLTQEGVMGAEYNKWSSRITATHNVTLPFTRMLLGPMDYTPGGFHNVKSQDFVPRDRLPLVQTTRGQALAMYVVYESPLQAVADTPDAYLGQTGFDFLKAVPASWDETRFLAGEIGHFIVIARRCGLHWFVGAMTNEDDRTLEISLEFLGEGRFCATIYADGDTPSALVVTEKATGRGDFIALKLAPSGGAAIRLENCDQQSSVAAE